MGNCGQKSQPDAAQPSGNPTSAGNGDAKAADDPDNPTFRDRRLSMSQIRDPNAKGATRHRRLSVYGSGGDDENGEGDPSMETPLPQVACKSIPGVEPVPGGSVAKINQDRAIAISPFADQEDMALFGVFDGHGRVGEKVSGFVKDNLPSLIANDSRLSTDACSVLKEAFVKVDNQLTENGIEASVSGTTAVCALVKGNHMWLANCGDSRAILGKSKKKTSGMKAVDLTIDQKPDTEDEKKRILSMGGHVTPAGANGSPARVWHNLRGLAMARSIGDHNAAQVGVISEPVVTEYDIQADDKVMIVASDGVWELLQSQDVIDIAADCASPTEACNAIIDQSAHMWKIEEGDYRDDISCIVVDFPWQAGTDGT